MADNAPTNSELQAMIAALTQKIEARGSSFRWSMLTSGAKIAWTAAVLIFFAGATFTYYRSNIVLRAEFEPVAAAVRSLAVVPGRLRAIEGLLAQRAICNLHQSTYIRDLADYAAKVRLTTPEVSPAYRKCLAEPVTLGN